MASKGGSTSPSGRTPFDGLTPRDFFTEWPHGELVAPAAFDAYPFVDDEPRQNWIGGLHRMRDLVLDYRHYVAENTRQQAARASGLSTNTLSNFNNGERFLKLGSYLALREAIPDRKEAAALEARRQALLDARWVERETRERLKREIDRRVEARVRQELRGRGLGPR